MNDFWAELYRQEPKREDVVLVGWDGLRRLQEQIDGVDW